MDWFNYLIVGSGPAGVSAARRLENTGMAIVDVGHVPEQSFPYKSLSDGLAAGDFEAMLGSRWEMLSNIVNINQKHAKLRASAIQYVTSGQPFKLYDTTKLVLAGTASYARGGMSNAWGAQLLRYNNSDLSEVGNWPISAEELEPYYTDLESHIGISGEMDSMYSFLGESNDMLPATPIVPAASYLLNQYKKRHKVNSNLSLGRARLAVLTKDFNGYPAYDFNETEFFTTNRPSLYTARRTLDELIDRGNIDYLTGYELISYHEFSEFVEITLLNVKNGLERKVRTKHLLLACGTLQTARLVLLNKKAFNQSLPFVDHPPTLLPLFIPRVFGASRPSNSFPVQLTGTLNHDGHRDMISFYYPGGMLWSDILADIPLPMDLALKLLPNLMGGLLVAQIWEISHTCSENRLSLEETGSVRIDYPIRPQYSRLGKLLTELRRFGAFSLSRFASTVTPGWGFHYAACLPMRRRPDVYETHVDGRLWDSQRIRVIDGSVLPSLPAKNHSLTLMANSARIADEVVKCGY